MEHPRDYRVLLLLFIVANCLKMLPVFLFYCVILSLLQCSLCMVTQYSTTSTGVFTSFITETFGMSDQGVIDITYSVGPSAGESYPAAPLLIAIINEGQRLGYYANPSPNSCNLPTLFREVIYGEGNITYYTSVNADQYSVLVMQCRNGNPAGPTHANIQVAMKNPRPSGSGYQYLAIDQVTDISILEGLIICYCILFGALACQIYFAW